jgi:hypothetical protein
VATKCYAHLPNVHLESPGPVPVLDGRLVELAFDAWLQLEDPAFGYYQTKYERARPVFFVMDVDDDASTADDASAIGIPATFAEALHTTHAAAFLSTLRDLPDPFQSVMYVHVAEVGLTRTYCGVYERELLLSAQPTEQTVLSAGQTHRLSRFASALQSTHYGDPPPKVLRIIEAGRFAAMPGVGLLNGTVHLVAALENALNPKGEKHFVGDALTETFARRAGTLLCPDFAALPAWVALFRRLYHIRSEAIHGQEVAGELQTLEEGLQPSLYGFLLLSCLTAAVRITERVTDDEATGERAAVAALRAELDHACQDQSTFDGLGRNLSAELLQG